jgi:hypothetical protein
LEAVIHVGFADFVYFLPGKTGSISLSVEFAQQCLGFGGQGVGSLNVTRVQGLPGLLDVLPNLSNCLLFLSI